MNSTTRPPRVAAWTGIAAIATVIAAQAYAIMTSPPDRDMGDLQKIMYVHVPAAWMTFLAFFGVCSLSARYRGKGRENDARLAASAAAVSAVFNGTALVLGRLGGRPSWWVWWTWDARLTTTLVLY